MGSWSLKGLLVTLSGQHATDSHEHPVRFAKTILRRSRDPEAAALVWAVGSRWGFAATLAQLGGAADSKIVRT